MLKKFYSNRKFEEILGLIGVIYILLIAAVAAYLIAFLVGATSNSLLPAQVGNPTLIQFAVDKAKVVEGVQ